MTRSEKARKVLKQDGKVFEVRDFNVKMKYRSRNYELFPREGVLNSTGRLDIFELRPKLGNLPTFSARWDGGSREEGKTERSDLDIDITGVSAKESKRFKSGVGGYSGHHTDKMPNEGHTYQVSLRTPNEKIFEGTVSFTLHRRLAFVGIGPSPAPALLV